MLKEGDQPVLFRGSFDSVSYSEKGAPESLNRQNEGKGQAHSWRDENTLEKERDPSEHSSKRHIETDDAQPTTIQERCEIHLRG